MQWQVFTFNPFAENTYVLWDESGECAIVDPGMSDASEERELHSFITAKALKPVLLLNTHCHIDHILGNAWCAERYGLELHAHRLDLATLERGVQSAMLFGVNYAPSPMPAFFVDEGDLLRFGHTALEVLFVPGHAPGHVAFVHRPSAVVVSGDVLFLGSVGRVDLPGCNAQDLVQSIQQKLYKLPDDYTVLPGHGPSTTIGREKSLNDFVRLLEQNLFV